jgi:hypothetical protein
MRFTLLMRNIILLVGVGLLLISIVMGLVSLG